jgi:integrase/recombinase XerD
VIQRGKRSISTEPIPSGGPDSSLGEAVQAFLLERRIAGATGTTVATYRGQLAPFLAWCTEHDIDLNALSVDDIRSYLAIRQRTSSSALFEAVRRLKTFFKWCHTEHICEDVAERIRLPKQEQKVIPALTVPQVRALLAVCAKDSFIGRRDESLLRLLIDGGLRISEALGLTVDDVNLSDGRVLVRHGKGQKQRIVPVGPRTQRALARYTAKRDKQAPAIEALFIATNGRLLNRRHVEQHLSRLAERAGIEGVRVTPHVLRHTCALWFLKRGGDAFSLQALLGHSSLEMTKRYVNMTRADVSEAHARFGAGELI